LRNAGYGRVDLIAFPVYKQRLNRELIIAELFNRKAIRFLDIETNPGLAIKFDQIFRTGHLRSPTELLNVHRDEPLQSRQGTGAGF
jgi:hypothetical protein